MQKKENIIFKSKIKYVEAKNKILKDGANDKQKIIETILHHKTISSKDYTLHLITVVIMMIRPLKSIQIAGKNTNHVNISNDVISSSRSYSSNIISRSFALNDSIKESMEETEKKDKKEAIIVDDSVTKHVIGLDISLEIEIVKVI